MRRTAVAVLAAAVALPAFAGFGESLGDWSSADRARYRKDMREAARRVAEGSARERRDSAIARREARLAAGEMKREARRLSAERREQARQLRIQMRNAMLELKQSLRTQARCWRDRNRNRI